MSGTLTDVHMEGRWGSHTTTSQRIQKSRIYEVIPRSVNRIHWEVRDLTVMSISVISVPGWHHGYPGQAGTQEVDGHKLGRQVSDLKFCSVAGRPTTWPVDQLHKGAWELICQLLAVVHVNNQLHQKLELLGVDVHCYNAQ